MCCCTYVCVCILTEFDREGFLKRRGVLRECEWDPLLPSALTRLTSLSFKTVDNVPLNTRSTQTQKILPTQVFLFGSWYASLTQASTFA